MKIRSVLLAFVLNFNLSANNFVLSEEISGEYCLNGGGHTGTLNFVLSGNSLSGSGVYTKHIDGSSINRTFTLTNTEVEYTGDNTIQVVWTRSDDSTAQVYHGSFSPDRKLIAGYFDGYSDASIKYPWFAELKGSCTESSISNNPEQIGTVSSNVDIHIPSATFGDSNIWVDLEYKGASGFDHLWRLKDYGSN